MNIIHKLSSTTSPTDIFGNCIFSDGSDDRYGDTIAQDGWKLSKYLKNPVLLVGHNSDFVAGKVLGPHIENGALRGRVQLAPPTASARIAEIHALVNAKILVGFSVGFIPLESEPRKDRSHGTHYKSMELVEISLTPTPANANCVMEARSLGISASTIRALFKPPVIESLAARQQRARQAIARARAILGSSKPSSSKLATVTPIQTRAKAVREKAEAVLRGRPMPETPEERHLRENYEHAAKLLVDKMQRDIYTDVRTPTLKDYKDPFTGQMRPRHDPYYIFPWDRK